MNDPQHDSSSAPKAALFLNPAGYCQCQHGCSSRVSSARTYAWGHKPKDPNRVVVRLAPRQKPVTDEFRQSLNVIRARLTRDADVYQRECDRLDEQVGAAQSKLDAARSAFDLAVDKHRTATVLFEAFELLYPERMAVGQ